MSDGFMAYGPDGVAHVFDSPEAYAEWMTAQHDLAQADNDRKRHDLDSLLEELNSEQLETLHTVIGTACSNPMFSFTTIGRILEIRSRKFNICPTCEKDHEAEERSLLGAGVKPVPTMDEVKAEDGPDIPDSPIELMTFEEAREAGVPEEERPGYEEKMREFDLVEALPDQPTKWRCGNCYKPYVSLDDRMMKPPGLDGCDGCQSKARWG